jgi:hypothetical protein
MKSTFRKPGNSTINKTPICKSILMQNNKKEHDQRVHHRTSKSVMYTHIKTTTKAYNITTSSQHIHFFRQTTKNNMAQGHQHQQHIRTCVTPTFILEDKKYPISPLKKKTPFPLLQSTLKMPQKNNNNFK